MKMVYERPVMRAEAFRTNAYCEGCNSMPGSSKDFSYFMAKIGQWTFFFDANTRQDGLSDNKGLQQHYFHEYNGELASSYTGDNHNDVKVGDYDYGTDRYFLEWSADNRAYYVYQDSSISGYSQSYNGPFTGGENTLQVRYNQNGGRGNRAQNAGGGYYYADYSLIVGVSADVTYIDESEVEYTMSW